jgi:L-fuculose-phosphate aldolase
MLDLIAPDVLDDILRYGRQMVHDGLVLGTAGNISVRDGQCVAITPSTVPYDEITVESLCLLDHVGRQIAGSGRPSNETPMHISVYHATDAAAIVHTHSPVAVALSTVVDELPAIHYAIAQFGGDNVRVAGYQRFGSAELAATAVEALEGRRGVLLRNHGTLTWGHSLAEAYGLAVLLEWLASVYTQARLLGQPALVSSAELSEVVAESHRLRYGFASG